MDQFTEALGEALASVANFLPKLVGALIILLIGWVVAKVLRTLTDKVLERVGFDKAVERGGIRKALAKSQYDASDLVAQIVYYAVLLFTLQLAFGVFGPNPISELLQGLIAYLPNIVVAIILIVVAAAIAQAVRSMISSALGGLSYGDALATTAGIAILAIGVFAALDQLRIAPDIVNGIFYAILAVIAGSAIVAIGGSGIQPLRGRWEKALQKLDDTKDEIDRETSRSDSSARSSTGSGGAPASGSPSTVQATPPPPTAHDGRTT